MSEIVFFGSATGVFKSLSKAAAAAGFRGTLTATEDVNVFTAAVKDKKVGIAGPRLYQSEYAIAKELKSHTRIFRGEISARIPSSSSALYSSAQANLVIPHGVSSIPKDNVSFSVVEAKSLTDESAVINQEWRSFIEPASKAAAEISKLTSTYVITVAQVNGLARSMQDLLLKTVEKQMHAAHHEQEHDYVTVGRSIGTVANRITMYPERITTVVVPPLPEATHLIHLAEGLFGGAGISSYEWAGADGTVFHTGDFVDGPNANPAGAVISLCQALLKSDKAVADKLYAGLVAAAAKQDTYAAAASGEFENLLASAVQSAK